MQKTLSSEEDLLACCLLDQRIIPEVRTICRTTDMIGPKNRRLYQTLLEMDWAGERIDTFEAADKAGWSHDEIVNLMDKATTAVHGVYHAKKLRAAEEKRRLAKIAEDMLHKSRNGEKPEDIVKGVMSSLTEEMIHGHATKQSIDIRSHLDGALKNLEERVTCGGVRGIESGIRDLDDITTGYRAGEFILIAARPSVGKTALGLQTALHAAEHGKRVCFVSIEMATAPIMDRLFSLVSGVPAFRIRNGNLTRKELDLVTKAAGHISNLPIFLLESPSPTVEDIRAEALRLVRRSGAVDLLIVDYLGLIRPPPHHENRNQEVAAISRGLKALGLELEIPLLALSQLRRAVQGSENKTPQLSDLRDSGALEQDADIVIFIHRPPSKESEAHLIVAKHRNGPVGSVRVLFVKEQMKFVPPPPVAISMEVASFMGRKGRRGKSEPPAIDP